MSFDTNFVIPVHTEPPAWSRFVAATVQQANDQRALQKPGALGKGPRVATALTTLFTFLAYTIPIL